MARFVTKFALAVIASTVWIAAASQMPAEESKTVSFALFAPGQSEKTISALTKLFTQDNKNASVSLVKNLPDAIASKADIVVLALSVKEFNSLGPYDADALEKRKVIGISYGAAKLYGEIGLKISWGACAHGMEPRIKVVDNATIAKAGFDKVFGVYAPNAPQYPASDVEYMPFGIFDGFPAIHKGLEDVDVVARFNGDLGYAPIVRQGNKILIGFNPHAEDWTEQFGDLMRKLAAALNEPLKNPGSQPVATHAPQTLEGDWAGPDPERVMRLKNPVSQPVATHAPQTLEGDWAGPDPERVMRLKNPVSQPVATHAPQTLEGDWAVPEAGHVMRLTRTNDGRSCSIEWLPGFANDSEKGFKPTRFDLLGDNVGATELPYGFAMCDHGFKTEYFTARLENDELVLESYSIFKDGSGRSNYHGGRKYKRAAHAASDAYPSLKRVPNFFSWESSDQRESGKRIWIRVDDTTFVERYPSNHENRFRILRSDKVKDVDGIVLQISDSSHQAFIPYKEIRNDAARPGNGPSNDRAPAAPNSTASHAEQPKLLMRADEQSPWQIMGAMNHVE
jgi:hypothetical protein